MNNIKKAFTLVEMLIVAVLASVILTVSISVYYHMSKIKMEVSMKETLIKGTYDIVEKLNITVRGYTLDYEEYFNRKIVGCNNNGGDGFTWNVGDDGYCKDPTYYGNRSGDMGSNWNVYYCTSSSNASGNSPSSESLGGIACEGGGQGVNTIYKTSDPNDIINGKGCWSQAGGPGTPQSYTQYKWQYWDTMDDQDGKDGCKFDDDDNDYGVGPIAIGDSNNVQELYLISPDEKKRTYIRRKLQATKEFGSTGNKEEWNLYTLEILKLRGFDAGSNHDFNAQAYSGVYDGILDTRSCNYSEGFYCGGSEVDGYAKYKLPTDENDGWAILSTKDITLTDWKMEVYPTADAEYYWENGSYQVNPYVKLSLQTKIYPENWTKFTSPEVLTGYQMDIQTTFNLGYYDTIVSEEE